MVTAKKSALPADKLAQYEELIATHPKIERKGDIHPYTSVNGHMFTYLDQTGTMSLRLPPDELEAFLKEFKTKLFVSYGVVKKEFAAIPADLLADTKTLQKYLALSYEHTKSLKPKPTTKKKKA